MYQCELLTQTGIFLIKLLEQMHQSLPQSMLDLVFNGGLQYLNLSQLLLLRPQQLLLEQICVALAISELDL